MFPKNCDISLLKQLTYGPYSSLSTSLLKTLSGRIAERVQTRIHLISSSSREKPWLWNCSFESLVCWQRVPLERYCKSFEKYQKIHVAVNQMIIITCIEIDLTNHTRWWQTNDDGKIFCWSTPIANEINIGRLISNISNYKHLFHWL